MSAAMQRVCRSWVVGRYGYGFTCPLWVLIAGWTTRNDLESHGPFENIKGPDTYITFLSFPGSSVCTQVNSDVKSMD